MIRLRNLPSLLVAVCALIAPNPAAAQSSPSDPVLVAGPHFDLLLTIPARRDVERDWQRVASVLGGCRHAMPIAEADSIALLQHGPETFAAPGPGGVPVVVLTVLAANAEHARCTDRVGQLQVAASLGVRIAFDTASTPDRDIAQVRVQRGDRTLAPLDERSDRTRQLAFAGFALRDRRWMRAAFDLAAFAPGPDGRATDIVVFVSAAAGGAPERIVVPWPAVRAIWEQLLDARAAGRVAVSGAPLYTRAPVETALRDAHAAYASGEYVKAVEIGSARVLAGGLSRTDALQGRVELGASLFALDDVDGARVVFGHLLETRPCFTLSSAASPQLRSLVDALHRPDARCSAQSIPGSALRAALLPGFSRPAAPNRRLLASLIPAVIVGASAYAISSGAQARTRYDDYLAWQFPGRTGPVSITPAAMYGEAESLRARGRSAWTAAGAVWGAQLAFAVWQEYSLARRLREVQGVGAAPSGRRLSVAPLIRPSGNGLVLSLAW